MFQLITALSVCAWFGPTAPLEAPAGARVRSGYELTIAADNIQGARFLEVDDQGRLFVSRPYAPLKEGERRSNQGDIVCLSEPDAAGVFQKRSEYLTGPVQLHGLCWQAPGDGDAKDEAKGGWLWYSTTGSIRKARDTKGDGKADELVTVIADGKIPTGGGHWWRSILVTKDTLYTGIGESQNASDETGTERQKIWMFNLDGSNKRAFCGGIRNTEKLRLRPGTTEVWGMDHGSDNFGKRFGEGEKGQPITDYNPPEEINHYEAGKFYGHPFVVGNRVPRYEFMDKNDILEIAARTTVPELCMPAHWAGNGFTFLDPKVVESTAGKPGALPADHAGDMIACFHGSWNRTEPGGYCVVRILWDKEEGRPIGYVKLVDGLSKDKKPLIRPVDAVQCADGSVLFSCDMTGRIYRIRYVGTK